MIDAPGGSSWLVSLAIAAIGALVNIAANIIFYAIYIGRHLEQHEKNSRMVEEHEKYIRSLDIKIAAMTGVANGVTFRSKGGG